MTTTSSQGLVTAEELLELSANGFYGELVRGELVEFMPPGFRHGKVVGLITYLLCAFVIPRELGTIAAGDSGVVLERDPDTVRGPDVAFYSAQTLPLDDDNPSYSEVVPDLAVEVGSPNDSMSERESRARMWVGHGVPLVWMVHPESRSIDVYRPGQEIETLGVGDQITGHDVIPGFQSAASDLFAAPR
ncbi:MAG: Uma2 family endonuclease [Chloroflexota bacterium]|nr:Uma2 family endonuclease [Chloroflexota bacterium]MDE2894049.1 Uma2 family endonuclease [Chloroflexota bacterium]